MRVLPTRQCRRLSACLRALHLARSQNRVPPLTTALLHAPAADTPTTSARQSTHGYLWWKVRDKGRREHGNETDYVMRAEQLARTPTRCLFTLGGRKSAAAAPLCWVAGKNPPRAGTEAPLLLSSARPRERLRQPLFRTRRGTFP